MRVLFALVFAMFIVRTTSAQCCFVNIQGLCDDGLSGTLCCGVELAGICVVDVMAVVSIAYCVLKIFFMRHKRILSLVDHIDHLCPAHSHCCIHYRQELTDEIRN